MGDGAREELATLGGGCFWCLEAVYRRVEGVADVASGYAGGIVPDPTYQAVCSGSTGHAEVVQVRFDSSVIGYGEILEIFFAIHDPTTPNRQGADVGSQYRSAIFHHTEDQEAAARQVILDLETEGVWDAPIVTELAALERFYPAEDYHKAYFERHGNQPYCQVVVAPKVAKFRQKFAHRLRDGD